MEVTVIRELEISELGTLKQLGEQFYSSSLFLNGFNYETAKRFWTTYISQKIGVIFGLFHDGKISGMLGGARYPDPNSGIQVASEFFWFKNGSGNGIELLKAFESWAKKNGCKKIHMVSLMDSPHFVNVIYKRKGYKPIETVYEKEI